MRSRWTQGTAALITVALGPLGVLVGVPDAAAVSHTGALDGYAAPVVVAGTYRPPVDAPVVDPFRPPRHRYGPGNRGLEYHTVPATQVRAIGAGQVAFAGQVGGRLAVTVLHPDGRRSSYTWLTELAVDRGELVARGTVLGRAADRLHLGVREGDVYVDPAGLFSLERRRAVLVPEPRALH